MSELWSTSLGRWSSSTDNDKKLKKIKTVLKKLTRKGHTNDIKIKMSQIRNESLSSLYRLNSSIDYKKINKSANESQILNNITAKDNSEYVNTNLNESSEISVKSDVDCDEYSSKELHLNSMNREDGHGMQNSTFIIDEFLHNNDSKNTKLIKVKIIVPKGTLNKSECGNDGIFEQDFFCGTQQNSQEALEKLSSIITEKFASLNGSKCEIKFPDFEVTSIDRTIEKFDPSGLTLHQEINNILSSDLNGRTFDSVSSLDKFTPAHKSSQILINDEEINKPNCSLHSYRHQNDQKYETKDADLLHKDLKQLETCIEEKVNNVKRTFQDILKENEKKVRKAKFNLAQHTSKVDEKSDIELPFPEIEEDELKRLVNRSLNYPPIMGKNALLAKANALRQQTHNENRDSEIIKTLVIERFNAFLMDHYKRTLKRATLKRSMIVNSLDNEENDDKMSQTYNKGDDEMSGQTVEDCSSTCSSISKSDKGFESSSFSLKSSKSSIQLQEEFKSFAQFNATVKSHEKNDSLISSGEVHFEEKLEYDAHEFLRDALGEEMNITFSSAGQSDNTMNSSTPSAQCAIKTQSEDRSIGSSDISALLSKASSLYSTISKRMRRSTNTLRKPPRINEEITNTGNDYEECFEYNDRIGDLMQESAVQHQIILQTSKALNYCKSTKEFVASCEQIEAERILLIATCKREAILDEIKRLEYEEINETDLKSLGSIGLSCLRFPAKENTPHVNDNFKRHREFSEWFLCVANCGSKLFASNAVLADSDGNVNFDNEFQFFNLLPDFEIHVSIYSMKVRNNVRNYSHESKYHLNKNVKSKCPTPQKILHIHKEKPKSIEGSPRPSSFTLWGKTIVKISDLSKNDTFKLKNVPRCSSLDGTLSMNINSSVKISETFAGFLNVGSESGDCITWNRRWCSLHGFELDYWNYPCEEGVCDPLKVLDLSFCVNSWIALADRSICARPKTLLLETVLLPNGMAKASLDKDPKYTIVRHFLAADNLDDMKNWEKRLNYVVSSLRNWNSMKCQLLFKKELSVK